MPRTRDIEVGSDHDRITHDSRCSLEFGADVISDEEPDSRFCWEPCAIILPILVFILVNLLIYANLSIDCTLDVNYSILGSKSSLKLYDFLILQSAKDLWDNSSYALSLLIFLWSGVFPWLKLFYLFIIYWGPESCGSKKGSLLPYFNFFGKWGLLDFYILCIFICIFETPFNIKSVGQFQLNFTIKTGMYAFVVTILITMYLMEKEEYKRRRSRPVISRTIPTFRPGVRAPSRCLPLILAFVNLLALCFFISFCFREIISINHVVSASIITAETSVSNS